LVSEEGLFPQNLVEAVSHFESRIIWKRTSGGGADEEIPEPQPGLDAQFDQANAAVDSVKEQLNEYLGEVRSQMRDRRIVFSHTKYRYELEVPEELVKGKMKPDHFELTSQKIGFQRFHTKEIKQLID